MSQTDDLPMLGHVNLGGNYDTGTFFQIFVSFHRTSLVPEKEDDRKGCENEAENGSAN